MVPSQPRSAAAEKRMKAAANAARKIRMAEKAAANAAANAAAQKADEKRQKMLMNQYMETQKRRKEEKERLRQVALETAPNIKVWKNAAAKAKAKAVANADAKAAANAAANAARNAARNNKRAAENAEYAMMNAKNRAAARVRGQKARMGLRVMHAELKELNTSAKEHANNAAVLVAIEAEMEIKKRRNKRITNKLKELNSNKNIQAKYDNETETLHISILKNNKINHRKANTDAINKMLSELWMVKRLDVSNCGLTRLDLSSLKQLTECNVSKNSLTELPKFGTNKLTHLNAGYNSLTEINLINQPNLTFLNVRDNKISLLPRYLFKKNMELNANYNVIRVIPYEKPKGMTAYISYNPLTLIHESLVPKIFSGKKVNISNKTQWDRLPEETKKNFQTYIEKIDTNNRTALMEFSRTQTSKTPQLHLPINLLREIKNHTKTNITASLMRVTPTR